MEAQLLLPSCTPLLLLLLHKQGTANNAEEPSSVPLQLSPSLSRGLGAIDNVEAPLPLPSRVLLPSPLQ